MTEYAYIIITEHRNPLGHIERYDYRWEGGNTAAISNSLLFKRMRTEDYIRLCSGAVFTLGPFQLRILEDDPFRDITYVARDGWRTTLRYYFHRATRSLDLIYRRLIISAAVWGLARYDRAAIPSWRDLDLTRWLTAMWRSKQ